MERVWIYLYFLGLPILINLGCVPLTLFRNKYKRNNPKRPFDWDTYSDSEVHWMYAKRRSALGRRMPYSHQIPRVLNFAKSQVFKLFRSFRRMTKLMSKTIERCKLPKLFRHILLYEQLFVVAISENANNKKGQKVVHGILLFTYGVFLKKFNKLLDNFVNTRNSISF